MAALALEPLVSALLSAVYLTTEISFILGLALTPVHGAGIPLVISGVVGSYTLHWLLSLR